MAKRPDIQYINCYVSGTMAYAIDPAPVHKKKAKLPKAKVQKRARKQCIPVYPIPMIAIALTTVFLILLGIGVGQVVGAHREAAEMQTYIESLQTENAQLQEEFAAGYDADEIREVALAMGMIPKEQAQQVGVQVMVPQKPAENSAWENFCAFLAGLFA